MGRNIYEGYCNLVDHFTVGASLNTTEIMDLVNCSRETAARIMRAIPDVYVERTFYKINPGKKRKRITLIKPFNALDLKLWVIRTQSEEVLARKAEELTQKADADRAATKKKGLSLGELPYTAESLQGGLNQLTKELQNLRNRVSVLEDLANSPWYKKGFKSVRTLKD